MLPLKAHVQNRRIVVDEPTDLPEGTALGVVVVEEGDSLDDMLPEDRARLEAVLDAGLKAQREGRVTGVLGLSADQRLALATELLDSVDGSDPAWEQEFARELRRRSEAFQSGAVVGIPATQVHAEARDRLRARSAL